MQKTRVGFDTLMEYRCQWPTKRDWSFRQQRWGHQIRDSPLRGVAEMLPIELDVQPLIVNQLGPVVTAGLTLTGTVIPNKMDSHFHSQLEVGSSPAVLEMLHLKIQWHLDKVVLQLESLVHAIFYLTTSVFDSCIASIDCPESYNFMNFMTIFK